MTVPWILQRYIFREMGKTFLLAAVALTGVLGLGGGVREMIKLGEVTPGQLLRIMALVLPLATALTLPVAALFSAAATYGRLAADNELVACRSSGINLHVLFLPGLVLSLGSAVITFCLINFVIPGMLKNLDQFVAGDIGALVQQRLKEPKGLSLRDFRLTADSAMVEDAEGGAEKRIVLRRVAFVEVDRGEWARFGTADALVAEIEKVGERLSLRGRLADLTYYDRQAGRFVDLAHQSLVADQLPALFGMRIKFLTLGELLHYRRAPHEWRDAAEAIARARVLALRNAIFDRAWEAWSQEGRIVLGDAGTTIRVVAENAARTPRHGAVELQSATVEESVGEARRSRAEADVARRRIYEAERAVVEFVRADVPAECAVRLDAYEVHGQAGAAVVRRSKAVFGPFAPPDDLLERVTRLTVDDLAAISPPAGNARFEPATPAGGDTSAAARAGRGPSDDPDGVRYVLADTARTISATLNERMAFCGSVVVLVILASSLGIVFRGAHVVVAFAVSFVPAVVVIVAIMMGKQVAQNAGTHGVGILLIWSGIIAVALADWWMLARVVRR